MLRQRSSSTDRGSRHYDNMLDDGVHRPRTWDEKMFSPTAKVGFGSLPKIQLGSIRLIDKGDECLWQTFKNCDRNTPPAEKWCTYTPESALRSARVWISGGINGGIEKAPQR